MADFTHTISTEPVELAHRFQTTTISLAHSFQTSTISLVHAQLQTAKIIDLNGDFAIDTELNYAIVYKPITNN